ncbi:MAG: hypothetical protein O7E52_14000 [Candidatus Poribacteria bacterium]|nr:hypothetical protein [Candidatus Poribacteria bacterium]
MCLLPQLRIDDVYVVTSVRQKSLTVEITIRNETDAGWSGTLSLTVTRNGQIKLQLLSQEVLVEANTSQTVRLTTSWENPTLWGGRPMANLSSTFFKLR